MKNRFYEKKIWMDPEVPQAEKDSLKEIFKVFVQDKKEFAHKAVRENPDDEQFLKVLDIYVRNFLTLDEYLKQN